MRSALGHANARRTELLLRALRLALLIASALWSAAPAAADGVSGTYTGSVSLRGNYYWERSTRVVAPSIAATMATPQGIRVDATYLIDAITSASVATGVVSDEPFTEKRHDFSAGAGYELDFGRSQLDLTLRGRFSREPDYLSRGFGFSSALSLDQRNTILRVNGYFVADDVSRVVRAAPSNDPDKLVASRPMHVGDLDTLSLGFAVDQLLNPLAWLTLGYDLGVNSGFTSNPYRVVPFATGGPAEPEKHPSSRLRHGVYTWLAQYIPLTHSSLRVGYRLYHDDWSITAHAPEARLYQELGEYVELRFRYRYYTQSGSFFFRPEGNLRTDTYRTADPKMAPFHDHTWGLKFRLGLGFFRNTVLRVFANAVLDVTFEYMVGTSRYLVDGAMVGQGGMIWPF